MSSVIFGHVATILSVSSAIGFGYLYLADRDKRKLMFLIAFIAGIFANAPRCMVDWEQILILRKLTLWCPLLTLSALMIAVLSSLLEQKTFDKQFKAFLVAVGAVALMVVIPIPVSPIPSVTYPFLSMTTIFVSLFIVLCRRELPDILFLIAATALTLAEFGRNVTNSNVNLILSGYVLAHMFIFLVFITSKENRNGGIASFFSLKKELEKTQEELKASQERLVKSERLAAIGQAATMVGHDLRNPLQAIANGVFYLNIKLVDYPISEQMNETLNAITESVAYADNIVSNLQSFTRERKPMLSMVDVNELVKDAVSLVKAPENVELVIEAEELPKIEVDKEMMKRVFVNLTNNGIQAMKEKGGMLCISTGRIDDSIEFRFKDMGVGISEENLEKIFTPFFTTKAQGMGVGLAICKRVVEQHNGVITVESKLGEGATFTVKLPDSGN